MPVPSYGAMPLSKMFLLVRILQALAMIIVIGICANFVQMIVVTGVAPPRIHRHPQRRTPPSPQTFLPTNPQTCIATLYIMLSVGYFYSHARLGLLVMAAVDSLLLIAFIVCAVTLGKPMAYLNCYVIGSASYAVDSASAYAFVAATTQNLNHAGSDLDMSHWAGATKSNCFQAKTVWGLSVALW